MCVYCQSCFYVMEKPIRLPCEHMYCKDCLKKVCGIYCVQEGDQFNNFKHVYIRNKEEERAVFVKYLPTGTNKAKLACPQCKFKIDHKDNENFFKVDVKLKNDIKEFFENKSLALKKGPGVEEPIAMCFSIGNINKKVAEISDNG